VPETGLLGVESDFVDAHPISHVVEIDIAGLHDPTMQGNTSMCCPTFMEVSVEGGSAAAMYGKRIVDEPRFPDPPEPLAV
jgi:hypothetical protein